MSLIVLAAGVGVIVALLVRIAYTYGLQEGRREVASELREISDQYLSPPTRRALRYSTDIDLSKSPR